MLTLSGMTRRQTQPIIETRSRRKKSVRKAGGARGLTHLGFEMFHMFGDLALPAKDRALRMHTLLYAPPAWRR